MKLYQVSWHDADDERIEWHETQVAARAAAREADARYDEGEKPVITIKEVTVPLTRDGVLHFARVYAAPF